VAHLKKRVTFAGVDYILVPVELWSNVKTEVGLVDHTIARELYMEMLAYEDSNELDKQIAEDEAREKYVREQSAGRR